LYVCGPFPVPNPVIWYALTAPLLGVSVVNNFIVVDGDPFADTYTFTPVTADGIFDNAPMIGKFAALADNVTGPIIVSTVAPFIVKLCDSPT
jgi:hypothetical protein